MNRKHPEDLVEDTAFVEREGRERRSHCIRSCEFMPHDWCSDRCGLESLPELVSKRTCPRPISDIRQDFGIKPENGRSSGTNLAWCRSNSMPSSRLSLRSRERNEGAV